MRNKIVKVFLGAALLLSFVLLVSCVSTKPLTLAEINMNEVTLDVADAAEHMLSAVTFDDTLVKMEDEIADGLFGIGGLYSAVSAYGSTGATAEAVVILRCGSGTDAETAEAKIAAYRDEMADVYADYNMPESEKLRGALLDTYGRYVVFIVSPDSDAAFDAFEAYVVDSLKK